MVLVLPFCAGPAPPLPWTLSYIWGLPILSALVCSTLMFSTITTLQGRSHSGKLWYAANTGQGVAFPARLLCKPRPNTHRHAMLACLSQPVRNPHRLSFPPLFRLI